MEISFVGAGGESIWDVDTPVVPRAGEPVEINDVCYVVRQVLGDQELQDLDDPS